MEMAMARLDDKGRLVIPKRLRDSVGISEKTAVFIYTFESLVFIRKVEADKTSVLESISRLGGKPPTLLFKRMEGMA